MVRNKECIFQKYASISTWDFCTQPHWDLLSISTQMGSELSMGPWPNLPDVETKSNHTFVTYGPPPLWIKAPHDCHVHTVFYLPVFPDGGKWLCCQSPYTEWGPAVQNSHACGKSLGYFTRKNPVELFISLQNCEKVTFALMRMGPWLHPDLVPGVHSESIPQVHGKWVFTVGRERLTAFTITGPSCEISKHHIHVPGLTVQLSLVQFTFWIKHVNHDVEVFSPLTSL